MYKALTRTLVRRSIAALNAGDPEPLLRLAAPDLEFSFPGDNSWSTMFRPVKKGRHRHATHVGVLEARAFAERYVAEGLQFRVEDILVNGPPWRMRVAIRAHDFLPGDDGDLYDNRAIDFLELRWGRVVCWEVYEDTERTALWEATRPQPDTTPGATSASVAGH